MPNFTDILREERDKLEQSKEESERTRDEWIEAVHSFYAEIEKWLGEAIKDSLVEVKTGNKLPFREGHLGQYTLNPLVLRFPNGEITIEPIGRLIVGAKGRVDIFNSSMRINKRVIVRLEDEDSGGLNWYLVSSKRPVEYSLFDKELFENLVLKLL